MDPTTQPLGRLMRIREAFCRALEVQAGQRGALLCELPPEIREEVCSLLTAHDAAGAFLGFPDSAALSTGERIGPYSIVELIGQGGMGDVYRARRDDGEFQREVAIKLVGGRLFAPEAERRFISERRILALLDHPNIVRMFDGGVWHGQRYLVMEFVTGEPITEYCAQRKLPVSDLLRVFQSVCAAVQYAHQRLVLHRDLKPANILVTGEGQIKLLDFGIARLLNDGAADDPATTLLNPFTLSCASPEQVRGEPLTLATDVYSLGLLLYELLSGRNPQSGGTRVEIEHRVLNENFAALDKIAPVPPDLDALVRRCLSKDPARRYPSVERFSADIDRYLNGLPVSARADSLFYRARKFVRRRALPLAALGAILVALLAGGLSTLAQWRRAERRFNEQRSLAHSMLYEVYDSIGTSAGSLPARRLLAARAQQYLDSLAREASGDTGLTRELAESYARLGSVLGRPYVANLGDTPGALESYRKAVALLEPEAQRRPNDLSLQEELADRYMDVALVVMRQQQAEACIAASRRAIAIQERLLDRYPRDPNYAQKLSRGYLRLGQGQAIAATRTGLVPDWQDVLASYQKSLAILEAASPLPGESWQASLRTMNFYVGYALTSLGDRTGDGSYYRQALDYALKGDAINRLIVAADPKQPNRRNLADGLCDVGRLRSRCQDFPGATRDLIVALAAFQAIAEQDPQNLEALRDVANAQSELGVALRGAGQRKQAVEADRKALALYERVSRTDPNSQEDQKYIATVRARIAAVESGK